MPSYRYIHLDVFTDHIFGGNQLAVFPEPAGLDTETMQAITREMAYSESTFVFAPEDPRTAVRVRIFTPGKELPMAGHPTVGTAFALAQLGIIPAGQPEVVFGLGVGPITVRLRWDGDRLAFAEMEQLRPTFGDVVDPTNIVATILNLEAHDIADSSPVQTVSCGVPFLFVPLRTRAAVDRAVVDEAALKRWVAQEIFIFSTEPGGDGATVYSRMFAPGLGVSEDPATGSASGPLGCYLVRYGLVQPERAQQIVSMQGVKMGRPSRIQIAIGLRDGEITDVRVGGTAVVAGEGVLRW